MPDIVPQRTNTTMEERIQYWDEVGAEAWELSREQFQVYHPIGAGVVGFGVSVFVRGWDVTVQEISTTIVIPVISAALYLAGVYVFNYMRAMMRIPVHYQRQVVHLTEELQAKPDPARSRKIERLQHHIMRGDTVTTQGRAKERKVPLEQLVARWEAEVKTDLHNFFSPSYVQCFLDSGDLPVYPGVEAGVTEEDKQTYLTLVSRIVRLRQFLAEVERGEG